MTYVVGIDLGGSSVKAIAATPAGAILARYTEPFDPERPRHFAETIRGLYARIQSECGVAPERTGLSAPGLAAADGRSISFMPGRLEGLEGLVWSEYLKSPGPLPVLNDAHAALLGEVWQGAAQGARDVILLTLGTGVGGAAMVDGRVLKGAIGRAGHFGHVCLDMDAPEDICNLPGSLEYHIGNYNIRERTRGRFQTTHDLILACEAGDAFATEVWHTSVRALACAIASLANALDPEVVIVGGGVAQAGATLFRPLAEFLDPIEWRPGGHRVRIVAAQLHEFAGAYGAAANALGESAGQAGPPSRPADTAQSASAPGHREG